MSSAIHFPGLRGRNFTPHRFAGASRFERPSGRSGGANSGSHVGGDESQIVQPNSGIQLSRTSSRLDARVRVKTSEDGAVTLKARAHLQYRYDFEADDGTKINIQARAKLSYFAHVDEEGNQTIRAKVKLHVSILQRNVRSDTEALQNQVDDEKSKALIADALAEFDKQLESAASIFDLGQQSGDGLIVDLVNAFNQLAGVVDDAPPPAIPGASSPPAAIDPPAATSPSVETPPPAEAQNSVDESGAEAAQNEASATAAVPDETQEAEQAEETAGTQTEEPTNLPAEAGEPNAGTPNYQSLRLRLRYRFAESLTQVVRAFDGEDGERLTESRTSQRVFAALKFSARYDVSRATRNDRPVIDASV